MEILQEIIVLVIFAFAVGYIFTKFIWKPSFLKKNGGSGKNCGGSDCGCH